MSLSAVRIALVYPDLLGTYGDGGNARIVQARATWRGAASELVEVPASAPVPGGCDVYLVGGGEDEPQTLAAAGIRAGALGAAVEGGAAVLAVCAGLQLLGTRFPASEGREQAGAGLVDLQTDPGSPRAVGDLVVEAPGLPLLYGYENHGGRTRLGPGLTPLGAVRRGIGNGAGQCDPEGREVDGVRASVGRGLVVGTYLHGPVLAQNPALADLLLDHVGVPGRDPADPRLAAADQAAEVLRAARAAATGVR